MRHRRIRTFIRVYPNEMFFFNSVRLPYHCKMNHSSYNDGADPLILTCIRWPGLDSPQYTPYNGYSFLTISVSAHHVNIVKWTSIGTFTAGNTNIRDEKPFIIYKQLVKQRINLSLSNLSIKDTSALSNPAPAFIFPASAVMTGMAFSTIVWHSASPGVGNMAK